MPTGNTTCILSASALLAAGWTITFGAGPDSHHLRIRGAARTYPICMDARGNPWVTLTPAVGQPAPTFELLDTADPTLSNRMRFPFLLDTGAEHSVVGLGCLGLLADVDTIPLVPISGYSGPPTTPSHSGFLRLALPPGASPPPPPGSAPSPGGTVHYLDSQHGGIAVADASVRRVRASPFPGLRDAAIVAERLNPKDGAAYAAFRTANPDGIPDDAPWPDPDTTYSKEHHIVGAGHKPRVFASRSFFTTTIRECMPPG